MKQLAIGSLLIAACCLAPRAQAQLSLFTVQNGVATPVGQTFDFGSVAVGGANDISFRIIYTGSASPYYLTYFSLQGTDFSVSASDWKLLPAAIPAAGLNFTVHFAPTYPGSYSANLQLNQDNPVSVILLGTGIPGLSVLLNGQPLAAGSVLQFGSVQAGSTQTVRLTLSNQTSAALTVPAITVQGSAFRLGGGATPGTTIPAGSSAEIDIVFAPQASGAQQGTLNIGPVAFSLQGSATSAPAVALPKPQIDVSLGTAASAQQGNLSVNLASPLLSSASGTVTLAFQPAGGLADDPSITFSNGSRSATFSVASGASTGQFDGGSVLGFSTGTTAGSLVFTVAFGTNTVQNTVNIPAAEVGIDAAVAARDVSCAPEESYCTTTNIELQINGWDNTRTISQLVFRFYNQSGSEISPGDIPWDGSAAFQQYFAASTLGGVFGLHAFFPVNGDSNQVTAAEVQITNSAGTAQTAKITF